VIAEPVGQWQAEADPMDADRVRHVVERRPGLPRPVDSRLLFLARTRLGRELGEGERVGGSGRGCWAVSSQEKGACRVHPCASAHFRRRKCT